MKFFIDAYPLYDHDYNIKYYTHHLFFTKALKERSLNNIRHMGMCYPNVEHTCFLITTNYTKDGMTYSRNWEKPFKSALAGLKAILKEARKHEAEMDK